MHFKRQMLENVSQLRHLNLSHCSRVTDRVLQYIGEKQPHVQYLDLSSCRMITADGLLRLSRGCRSLHTLLLKNCYKLTAPALVRFLANSGAPLRVLSLKHCFLSNDAVLQQIAASCRLLQVLDVAHCVRVTEEGARAVAAQCRQLNVAVFTGCPGVRACVRSSPRRLLTCSLRCCCVGLHGGHEAVQWTGAGGWKVREEEGAGGGDRSNSGRTDSQCRVLAVIIVLHVDVDASIFL